MQIELMLKIIYRGGRLIGTSMRKMIAKPSVGDFIFDGIQYFKVEKVIHNLNLNKVTVMCLKTELIDEGCFVVTSPETMPRVGEHILDDGQQFLVEKVIYILNLNKVTVLCSKVDEILVGN